ncbi:hypothetical protein Tco_1563701 [Tanacetum coccineum]
MSKGKKDKNRVFVVNSKHDGIFSPYPFSYIHGDEKQLTDFDFDGMSYDNLRELVKKLVHCPVSSLYYCKVRKPIKQGLCRLENDADVQEFLKTRYEIKWVVDLYVEHHGYDPMDYKNSNDRDYESPDSSDAYCFSDDEHVIDYVDFYHGGERDVVVKNITTNDLFLTKLYSNNGIFRGFINEPIPVNEDLHIEDPDSSSLEPTHQIQRGIAYPRHDPLQPWNEMQPILCMRVFFQKKVKAKKQLFTESHDDANKGTSKEGEGSSRNSNVSPNWTKSKIASSRKSGQPQCGFRLFMPLLKMKAATKEKFLINVSLGQCKRAKQRALYDFEGGLIEHYARESKMVEKQVEEGLLVLVHILVSRRPGVRPWYRGLLDAVSDWFPNAKHKKCTKHVFANFKKKFSGVQL